MSDFDFANSSAKHTIRPSLDPRWDFDILADGHLVTRFNGGRQAAENVCAALDGQIHDESEAQEVADAIRVAYANRRGQR